MYYFLFKTFKCTGYQKFIVRAEQTVRSASSAKLPPWFYRVGMQNLNFVLVEPNIKRWLWIIPMYPRFVPILRPNNLEIIDTKSSLWPCASAIVKSFKLNITLNIRLMRFQWPANGSLCNALAARRSWRLLVNSYEDWSFRIKEYHSLPYKSCTKSVQIALFAIAPNTSFLNRFTFWLFLLARNRLGVLS